MDALTQYLEQNRDRFVEDLKTVLRIPSVSAQPKHKGDMRALRPAHRGRT